MDVVFDTNVLISATIYDGSVSQKLLFKLIRADNVIYSSTQILAEYQNVLKRDFGYSEEECAHILEKVISFIKLVTPKRRINIVQDDPDDNKIIECAVEASCRYILTYDKHILKLGEFARIKIIKPEDALKLIA